MLPAMAASKLAGDRGMPPLMAGLPPQAVPAAMGASSDNMPAMLRPDFGAQHAVPEHLAHFMLAQQQRMVMQPGAATPSLAPPADGSGGVPMWRFVPGAAPAAGPAALAGMTPPHGAMFGPARSHDDAVGVSGAAFCGGTRPVIAAQHMPGLAGGALLPAYQTSALRGLSMPQHAAFLAQPHPFLRAMGAAGAAPLATTPLAAPSQ
jgi:hypothetical protein